jgi:autotransporter adhesin
VAIGAGTVNDVENTVSIGDRRMTWVADGIGDNDAVNVKQLKDALASVDTAPSQADLDAINNKIAAEKTAREAGDADQANKLAAEKLHVKLVMLIYKQN